MEDKHGEYLRGVRPLYGRIICQLEPPKVSSLVLLPDYSGGADAVVISVAEGSVVKPGDHVLLDREGVVKLYDENPQHDVGDYVIVNEDAVLCLIVNGVPVPLPGWVMCVPSEPDVTHSGVVALDRERTELLKVSLSASKDIEQTDTIVTLRSRGFDIRYNSHSWRLLHGFQDCLCILEDDTRT